MSHVREPRLRLVHPRRAGRLRVLVVLAMGLVGATMSAGCVLLHPTRPRLSSTWPSLMGRERARAHRAVKNPRLPLTLPEALVIALANNPEVAARRWAVRAARARRKQALAGHYPELGLMTGYRHHWHAERLVPARGQDQQGAFSRDIFWGDVALSIPLFAGGRVWSDLRHRKWMARAAGRRMARTREELVWSVKSAYYALLGIQRMVRALEQSKRALEEHYRRTEDLVRAKKAARVDLLKIDVRLATMKYRLFAQRGLQRIGRRALCTLLGIGSIRTDALLVKGSLTYRRPELDIRKLTARAIARRADLRELRHLARAQAAQVDSARAGYWPVVSASLTFGLRLSAQGEYDDLGFAGLTISYPLLGWLSTAPKVAEANAELGVLREKIRKLALAIQRDVEVAVIKVRTAVAQIEATRRSIAKAKEVLRVEREKAALGRGTTRDVLDAQADLLLAETSYYQGLAGFQTALALLELATGNDR